MHWSSCAVLLCNPFASFLCLTNPSRHLCTTLGGRCHCASRARRSYCRSIERGFSGHGRKPRARSEAAAHRPATVGSLGGGAAARRGWLFTIVQCSIMLDHSNLWPVLMNCARFLVLLHFILNSSSFMFLCPYQNESLYVH